MSWDLELSAHRSALGFQDSALVLKAFSGGVKKKGFSQ
ncbi:hypothetical protein DNFV4_04415 [Nitrospira tepida]|uniref:Uncharacterized protein n=1 Tax=Nitrospira tepida TaxID=2973512 RepID=A0AA86N392_9BACT|nr:hypothetical protein DNFV4_04415 [Nitrospira tepida]